MPNRVEHVARDLAQTIDAALPELRAMSDAAAAEPREPGKWSNVLVTGYVRHPRHHLTQVGAV